MTQTNEIARPLATFAITCMCGDVDIFTFLGFEEAADYAAEIVADGRHEAIVCPRCLPDFQAGYVSAPLVLARHESVLLLVTPLGAVWTSDEDEDAERLYRKAWARRSRGG